MGRGVGVGVWVGRRVAVAFTPAGGAVGVFEIVGEGDGEEGVGVSTTWVTGGLGVGVERSRLSQFVPHTPMVRQVDSAAPRSAYRPIVFQSSGVGTDSMAMRISVAV